MKCHICGTESNGGSLVWGIGFCCSEDCAQIAQGRRKAFHDELLAEPLSKMPETLETHDFERWALKLALHCLKTLSDDERKRIADANPIFLVPEEFSLDLKDRILRHIPKCYVSETRARGHERLFHGGTYCFRQPVPYDVIVKASKKAEIIN